MVLNGAVILSVCDTVCLSVILFVRYRNHFPVVQFQNQAHIRNPHGTGQVFKSIWDAEGSPIFFTFFLPPPSQVGCPRRPKFILFLIFFHRRRKLRFS